MAIVLYKSRYKNTAKCCSFTHPADTKQHYHPSLTDVFMLFADETSAAGLRCAKLCWDIHTWDMDVVVPQSSPWKFLHTQYNKNISQAVANFVSALVQNMRTGARPWQNRHWMTLTMWITCYICKHLLLYNHLFLSYEYKNYQIIIMGWPTFLFKLREAVMYCRNLMHSGVMEVGDPVL